MTNTTTPPVPSDTYAALVARAIADGSSESLAVALDCAMAEGLRLELPGRPPIEAAKIAEMAMAGGAR